MLNKLLTRQCKSKNIVFSCSSHKLSSKWHRDLHGGVFTQNLILKDAIPMYIKWLQRPIPLPLNHLPDRLSPTSTLTCLESAPKTESNVNTLGGSPDWAEGFVTMREQFRSSDSTMLLWPLWISFSLRGRTLTTTRTFSLSLTAAPLSLSGWGEGKVG